jgi:hypothetical protein
VAEIDLFVSNGCLFVLKTRDDDHSNDVEAKNRNEKQIARCMVRVEDKKSQGRAFL